MSRDTVAATRAEMKALLDAAEIPEVTVFDHEPSAKNLAVPMSVTLFTSGITPVSWLMLVRLYAQASVDPLEAQHRVDRTLPLIEEALTSHYGEITWDIGYSEELDTFVASATIPVGREDF